MKDSKNAMSPQKKRKSGVYLMGRLLVELKPLLHVMLLTITLGVLGFLAAIGIATFATLALGGMIDVSGEVMAFGTAITFMVVCAISRGLFRYGEQLSGHYIAFKLLAVLRDKTFAKLRTLAPAKLQGKDKGDLISLITSDIELLEVFYAHTIAPIAIAILTNGIIAIALGMIHPIYGWVSATYFLIVGFVIPYLSSATVSKAGVNYRKTFASSNQFILDSLRGLKEILQFNQGNARLEKLNQQSHKLNVSVQKIKSHEGIVNAITSLTITSAILTFTGIGYHLYTSGAINITFALAATVMLASSFGPVTALSNLSNTLAHTLACAERLFELLDEIPEIEEVNGMTPSNTAPCLEKQIKYEKVAFNYPGSGTQILKNVSVNIKKGEKIALVGKSGIGKSTFIKLLMRYFDVSVGRIQIDDMPIRDIPTADLRAKQSLMEQETYLFNDTILNNLKIGNPDADEEDVIKACQKASIHDFIQTLPDGYHTNIGELGGRLSSGERQRLGLARAFLHDGEVLILDEPTSNLDALNEGAILKSLYEHARDKTMIMISHRKSTTAFCERVYHIKSGQLELEGGVMSHG